MRNIIYPSYQALAFILLFFSTSTFAQKVMLSERIDLGRENNIELITMINNSLILYQEGRNKHYLRAFDEALKPLWKEEINYPKRNVFVLDVLPNETGVEVFYAMHDRGKTYINTKYFNEWGKELDDHEIAVFFTHIPLMDFDVIRSVDKQKLLFYYIRTDGELDWTAYDRLEQKQIWLREKSFGDINYLRDYKQLLINNSGEVFIILDRNNLRRKRRKHEFVVHQIAKDGAVKTYRAAFPNFLTYDVLFDYDEMNKQLLAAGLYAKDNYNADGLFYMKIIREDSALIKRTPFETTFIRSLTGEKRKKLDGVSNLEIQDLVLRRDGGLICIAEQNFRYQYQMMSTFYNDNPGSTQTDYLYENVLVASIHPDGTLHWKEVLYKSQSSENDNARYSSYFLMKTAANFRLLYNDDIRWNTNIFEYVVDGLGKANRNRIFIDEKVSLMPEFKEALQISANALVAASIRSNKLWLIKISYE
jgi:hypothetical protein